MINLFPSNYRSEVTSQIIDAINTHNKICVQYFNDVGKNPYFNYLATLLTNRYKRSLSVSIVFPVHDDSAEALLNEIASQLGIEIQNITFGQLQTAIAGILVKKSHLFINVRLEYLRDLNSNQIAQLKLLDVLRSTDTVKIIPIAHCFWTQGFSEIDLPLTMGMRIIMPAFSKKDFHEALYYFENKNTKLNPEQRELFWKISGGIPIIYKQFYLFCIENGLELVESSFQDFVNSDRATNYINTVVRDTGSGLSVFDKSCLKKLDLINIEGDFFSEFLKQKMTQEVERVGIAEALPYLTATENRIYTKLSKTKNIITRLEIAKQIWSHAYLEKYSEYVIDKHISNIRKKLRLNMIGELRTIKGQGFVLNLY